MKVRAKVKYQRILLTSNTPKPHREIILHFFQRCVAVVSTHFAQHDTDISVLRKKQHTLSNEKKAANNIRKHLLQKCTVQCGGASAHPHMSGETK